MKVHELTHEISVTTAIFGRSKDIQVVLEGNSAYTDGSTIVLPSLPDTAEISKETAMIIRGYVDHEAGHVRHSDFDVIASIDKDGKSNLRKIHNCLEDVWMEKKVIEEYAGAEKNIRSVAEFVSGQEHEFAKENPSVFKGVTVDSIGISILKKGREAYAGENNNAVFDLLDDNIKEWSKKWVESIDKCRSTKDTLSLARAIEKLVMQDPELESSPEDFEFEPQDGEGEGKAEGEGKPKDDKDEGKQIDKGQGILDKFSPADWLKKIANDQKTVMKPAGGNMYRVISTRFDEVFTRTSQNTRRDPRQTAMRMNTVTDYNRIIFSINGTVNVMKSKLRRVLMAKENRDWDFGRQQGRLDSKRLTSAFNGVESVYKVRKDREEFDTAVHLLVDMSGSMCDGKEVVAGQAAIAFCECLEGTGIKYQVSGFDNTYHSDDTDSKLQILVSDAYKSGEGFHRYEPLNLVIFKGFSENLQVAKGALSALTGAAGGNNSDRDAVLWAANELKNRPEKRKILFVFSDGSPANDQINIPYRDNGLDKGLKDAIEDITKSIECVGIGIKDNSVNKFYKNHVVINNLGDLAGATFSKLSEILTEGKLKLR
jgi:cobalamin biosynthesis protein CobT